MKRTWDYNRLKHARIKSIALGLIMMGGLTLFTTQFIESARNQVSTNFLLPLVIYLFPVLLFYYFPMRQVIEFLDKSEFATYYSFGWLKLNYKTYSIDRDAVIINQDDRRYYCLTIRTKNNGDIIIERYPTLDSVTARANDLKEIFGLETNSK